jgi:hypothetical protein
MCMCRKLFVVHVICASGLAQHVCMQKTHTVCKDKGVPPASLLHYRHLACALLRQSQLSMAMLLPALLAGLS